MGPEATFSVVFPAIQWFHDFDIEGNFCDRKSEADTLFFHILGILKPFRRFQAFDTLKLILKPYDEMVTNAFDILF